MLYYLYYRHYPPGDYVSAIKITTRIAEIKPGDAENEINALVVQENLLIGKESRTAQREREINSLENLIAAHPDPLDYLPNVMMSVTKVEEVLVESICRGDIKPTAKQLAPLRCKFLTNNLPFLKIAPFKVEELSLEPYITVFHEVISDAEIAFVKKLSQSEVSAHVLCYSLNTNRNQ